MKEIGGYFEIEKLISNQGEYYKDLISLNTARNALIYLVKAKKIKKIYIPYYLCKSVQEVCDRENVLYSFYHIGNDFRPVFNKQLKEDEYLYIVNYYGQLSNSELTYIRNKYRRIIIDNVQAFFQEPIKGIDVIYSCRKFFGVPDGAYLHTECNLKEELEIDNSNNRTKHLFGRAKDGASFHYQEFKNNDLLLKTIELKKMSNLTHNMLSDIDYMKIKEIRTANYRYLYEHLQKFNKLNIRLIEGAFSYPFYCDNGLKIKKELANKGIYIPTLWPNVLEMDDCIEKRFTSNILPLPCDQRYNINDMEYIVEELFKCINLEN